MLNRRNALKNFGVATIPVALMGAAKPIDGTKRLDEIDNVYNFMISQAKTRYGNREDNLVESKPHRIFECSSDPTKIAVVGMDWTSKLRNNHQWIFSTVYYTYNIDHANQIINGISERYNIPIWTQKDFWEAAKKRYGWT